MSLSSSESNLRFRFQWLVIAVLALVIAAVALPQYLSAQWPWHSPPNVAQIRTIRALKNSGLSLEGWSADFQQKVQIGGDEWSVQQLTQVNTTTPQQIVLFLKPQGESKAQPEVEWIDLEGAQKWQTSDQRRIHIDDLKIDTFRAWNENQTFAVAQWYAMPQSGHPAPYHWFWKDQGYQWSRDSRLPWIAVSLLLPMQPLGDINPLYPELENLSQQIQASLDANIFSADT
ncbi:MAG: cyanoexosortase B system-associated protein [Cyanobacteria bacterium P01_D01_bin.156]